MAKKRRSLGAVFGTAVKHRKQIAVGEKGSAGTELPRAGLIINQTFAGDDLTDRFRIVPGPGRSPSYRFTLDELAGYVAAEANHAKVKKLEKELRLLYARIAAVLESQRMSVTDPCTAPHASTNRPRDSTQVSLVRLTTQPCRKLTAIPTFPPLRRFLRKRLRNPSCSGESLG